MAEGAAMKNWIVIPMLALTMTAFAQDRFGVNDPATQAMMEEMQNYQVCIAKIDQSQFADIEQRQLQFEDEVRTLCTNGRRDEAQARAIKFGKEMASHPAITEIRKCSELVNSDVAKEMLQDLDFDLEGSNTHVCDEML